MFDDDGLEWEPTKRRRKKRRTGISPEERKLLDNILDEIMQNAVRKALEEERRIAATM